MSLSEKEVEHIATLGRLAITDEEKKDYSKTLNQILEYVDKLQELDTTGVEPMTGAIELVHVVRDDEIKKDFTSEELLKNAPDVEGTAVKVPKMG